MSGTQVFLLKFRVMFMIQVVALLTAPDCLKFVCWNSKDFSLACLRDYVGEKGSLIFLITRLHVNIYTWKEGVVVWMCMDPTQENQILVWMEYLSAFQFFKVETASLLRVYDHMCYHCALVRFASAIQPSSCFNAVMGVCFWSFLEYFDCLRRHDHRHHTGRYSLRPSLLI